ncbi:MAG: biotin--[acetyl-CoA-carboxylase] ligase [Pseudomonadota bacterium]
MATPSDILRALRSRAGDFVSGQALSDDLRITRTAIWKHVKALRASGYAIESRPKLGYRFVAAPDALLPTEIPEGLNTAYVGRQAIAYFRSCPSTNDAARDLGRHGAAEGSLAIAEGQTKGRGRLGRGWFSPPGKGVYVSVLLRPNIAPQESTRLTLLAAVAAAAAVTGAGLGPNIRWPNDVLVGGRKVAGILTELEAEGDRVNQVVLGVGINVNITASLFPRALRDSATSMRIEAGTRHSRLRVLQNFLEALERRYEQMKAGRFEAVLEEWRGLDITRGSRVRAVLLDGEIEGRATDIDQDGALLIAADGGFQRRITAGDIKIIRQAKPE